MLTTALQNYSSNYTHNIKDKDYYLYWLENDILLELNQNKAMLEGIQSNLQRAFPNKSCHQINQVLNANKTESAIKSNIEYMWSFLPENGRQCIIDKHK